MIYRISANQPTFREVVLQPGFNVVIADVTKQSSKKDSRNGLGKSTLIEIIHFCLGSQTESKKGLFVPKLNGWAFSLDFDLGERRVEVTRHVNKPNEFRITGDVAGLGELVDGEVRLTTRAWRDTLGRYMFGIPERDEVGKWSPTFRGAFAYTVRRGKGAFLSPFSNYKSQATWDKQVHNAFLLGLAWEDAQAVQLLREKENAVKALKAAAKSGVIDGFLGDVGKLEADRVQLAEQVEQSEARLASFRVHEDYQQIERKASELTQEIHALSNANVLDTRRASQLRAAVAEETGDYGSSQVVRLYEDAGVQLPGMVLERLEAVQAFHQRVVANRRDFLQGQLSDIETAVAARTDQIKRLTEKRAELLLILSETGALDEYTRLQQRHLTLAARLKDIEAAVANLKKFEVGQSEIKVEKEQLHQQALRDYEERAPTRERAIRLFNSHSHALYEAPGNLLINVKATGFSFDVKIERAGSAGVTAMQVFCYDLTLAELWACRCPSPSFLVHDSLIFDGVDERQVGRALGRAAAVSEKAGFQYVCTINSDAVAEHELPDDFDLNDYVRLRLTDASPAGSLLGIRF